MLWKMITKEEGLHKKISERTSNEFYLQQINKTPEKLGQILSKQKNLEIENRKLKNQEKKWTEHKENTPLQEVLKEFEQWFKRKNNFWMLTKDFFIRSKELIKQDFYSIRWLIEFVAKSEYQRIFVDNFLWENLSNFSEDTQLATLYLIWSNWNNLMEESAMDAFYRDFPQKTQSEKVAKLLITRANRYAREYILYNEYLKKDFMLNEVVLRLMDDKSEFVREVAFEIRDKLQWKYNFVN